MGSSRPGNSTRVHSPRSGKRPPVSKPDQQIPAIGAELTDIRLRLGVAMSAAYVASAALKAQDADSDVDAALVLQRSVGDVLDAQIERLDVLAARCKERRL
ncbi:MAG: hypothetical protein ACJ8R9_15585 [Steroidobacteraceae bacterium]